MTVEADEELRSHRLLEHKDKLEDLAFLQDQRTLRLQYIGQKDEVIADKVENKGNNAKAADEEKNRVGGEKELLLEQDREAMKRELEAGTVSSQGQSKFCHAVIMMIMDTMDTMNTIDIHIIIYLMHT